MITLYSFGFPASVMEKVRCYLLPQIPKDVLFALCMPGRELATGT